MSYVAHMSPSRVLRPLYRAVFPMPTLSHFSHALTAVRFDFRSIINATLCHVFFLMVTIDHRLPNGFAASIRC